MTPLRDGEKGRDDAGREPPPRRLPAFLNVLPAPVRYKALVHIGRRSASRGHFETARMAFERAAQLFPGRAEARQLLDDVRRRLGGTEAVPISHGPLLPLRRNDLDAEPQQPVRGMLTGNVWKIEGRLGQGQMGVVFRARNLAVNSRDTFALKTYHGARAWEATVTRLFRREALTWMRLGRHPNIVQAFWLERLEGALCIVMEYVPGGSLRDAIKRGPLPPRRALSLALNLCDGLRYARDAGGVIHLDVKPANCLIAADGTLKLADFGISTVLRGLGELGLYRDFIGGTEGYQAPEQVDPTILLDERADIHAFGITLGEMLRGELLGRDRIADEVAHGRLAGPLWELVRHSVEADRERRPPNLDELRRGLESCCADLLKASAPPPPTAPQPSPEEYQDRAAAFISLGEYSLAIETYRLAIQKRSDDPALWAGLCAALSKSGDCAGAIEAADQGIGIRGKTSSLLNNKGQALAAAGRPGEALRCFDEVLGFDSANPVALCNRAEALWKLNDPTHALEACQVALASHPRFVRALVMKANILLDMQRVDEAYQELQHAALVDRLDPEVLLGLSTVLDRLGRLSEALGYVDDALAHNEANAALLLRKGWMLLKLNRGAEAIEYLDGSLALNSNDVEALRAKGLALVAFGKRDEAVAVIRTALRLDPGNPLLQQALFLAESNVGD